MCNNEELFEELHDLEETDATQVTVGNGQPIDVVKKGTVNLQVEIRGVMKNCKLIDVLFVPDLCFNLVSVGKASEAQVTVIFSQGKCNFVNAKSKVIATGRKQNGLFI